MNESLWRATTRIPPPQTHPTNQIHQVAPADTASLLPFRCFKDECIFSLASISVPSPTFVDEAQSIPQHNECIRLHALRCRELHPRTVLHAPTTTRIPANPLPSRPGGCSHKPCRNGATCKTKECLTLHPQHGAAETTLHQRLRAAAGRGS